ncbi:MAG: ribulose-phosphate 3-epimerase [Alphaproteobacteria bacterium]|nr:ribulose-phosphate 3-epimerase [Alphaproteobacteria bacterium]
MNHLIDSAFLCLDIGSSAVHGIAHRVRNARIVKSAMFVAESTDTVYAIKSVVDELESQIGRHFDNAYITGNFGESVFSIVAKNTIWSNEHKITAGDVRHQAAQITTPDGHFAMHIIPLQYTSPHMHNMLTPIGHIDNQLISVFGAIFYNRASVEEINTFLRHALIQPNGFYDSQFVLNSAFHKPHETIMFIDLGAMFTTASIWSDRGPLWHYKTKNGGTNITTAISEKFDVPFIDADRIKRAVFTMLPKETDRFAPADVAYDFSRADINDIVVPYMTNIIEDIKYAAAQTIEKHQPTKIIVTGGASDADGVVDFISSSFGVPTESAHVDAIVQSLSEHIWNQTADARAKIIARNERISHRMDGILKLFHKKPKKRHIFVPILPSTMCFNMNDATTYTTFDAAGISMLHVDIMDGLYVNKITGSIEQLRAIRARTTAHLHVHLMTESPNAWAADAIAAGADTVIVSTNTSGVKSAIRTIKASGRRAGVALNPDTSPTILKPILRDLDEVMVMAVEPGATGQEFMPACLHKISVLAATRKKYGLKFTISVDGGINEKTAQRCWEAGADLLISGAYLARSNDFPVAVQSLLKKQ